MNAVVDGPNASINSNEEEPLLSHAIVGTAHHIQKRVLFNFFIYSLCYFLVFSGFWGLSNLQSTINASEGLGDYSLVILYGCSMLSSLFLPTIFIEGLGCKTTLIVGAFSCSVYLAANALARWDVMMAGSVVFGLVNGPYSAAQVLYVDEMATRFQATVAENAEFVMSLFFGVFMFSSELTQISGNLISYYALRMGNGVSPDNVTNSSSECGLDFLNTGNDTNQNLDPPSQHQRNVLIGSYVALAFGSVFIMTAFMAPLRNDRKPWTGWQTTQDRLLSSLKMLQNPHQLLLIPFSIYISLESQFYCNEITQAYIACSWGIHHVGFVSVCFGVCGALTGLLVGPVVKCTSLTTVISTAICANVAICLTLVWWTPTPDDVIIYFVIAGLWGMGDALWWSQIPALYGLTFPNDREAAFSNLYFWNFLGALVSYAYARSLRFSVKMYILLTFLIAGTIGYWILIFQTKRTSRRKDYTPIPEN